MLLSMHKQMSTRPFGFITGAGIIKKLNLIHDVYRDPVFMEEVYVKFVLSITGYLTEKSLFYYNPLNPHLQRRLNDDMSHYPAPYKLMRSMLMSPGSLSGYTFYRVRPESADTIGML